MDLESDGRGTQDGGVQDAPSDDCPRFSEKETEYVLDVLRNRFDTQKNGRYNSALESQFASRFNMPFGKRS